MVCHQCGKPVEAGQLFYASCGASLRGVTEPTQRVSPALQPAAPASPPASDPTEEWAAHSPARATNGAVTTSAATTTTPDSFRSSLDSVPDLTGLQQANDA